ncbi:hypothetical protein ACJMK2_038748 [Sinanodonta woodiana]|uniref:Mab-21-like HhH/H2TH-like domain-containing protein n=1 Tax=Sinanodonta woodiana TaxID=1069815 RepID=A0ABD3W9Z5_SINWO
MSGNLPIIFIPESFLLSQILDDVGLTQDDRQKMAEFANVLETIHNFHSMFQGFERSVYFFGSRSEGATTPDLQSDTDYLFCWENKPVSTELSQWTPHMENGLMISEEDTHPGYVKIQQLNPNKPEPLYGVNLPFCIRDIGGRILRLSLDFVKRTFPNSSGPAETRPRDTGIISSDYVTCRRCRQWPPLAENWLLRRRPFNWPSSEKLLEMKKYGCFVVPIGYSHSMARNVEWRLSFTHCERDLVRMFNNTQLKVFVILKMIKTSFIKPVVEDKFTTYHCKVCVFWMLERTDPRIWKPENLIMCVLMCLKTLYQWLSAGFCPDYFIPENNLYDKKLYGSVLTTVRDLIGSITEKTILLRLKQIPLDDVGERLKLCVEKTMFLPHSTAAEKRNEEINLRERAVLSNISTTREKTLFSIQRRQTNHVKVLTTLSSMMQSEHATAVKAAKLMFPFIETNYAFYAIAQELENNADGHTRERLLSLITKLVQDCKKTDVTSERLKLVGVLICIGEMEKAVELLEEIKDELKSHCIRLCGCYENKLRKNNDFTEKVITEKWTTEELLQKCVAYCVMYTTLEMSIVPKAMRMEFFRISATPAGVKADTEVTWRHMAVADSGAYILFLQYQLIHQPWKQKEKQQALVDLMCFIIRDPDQAHKETSYNLLGYSLMEEGNLAEAFWCFARSIEVRPIHNAAMWHMCTLLSKLVNDKEVNIYTRNLHS